MPGCSTCLLRAPQQGAAIPPRPGKTWLGGQISRRDRRTIVDPVIGLPPVTESARNGSTGSPCGWGDSRRLGWVRHLNFISL
jgi:hypothetical protein